MVSAISKLSKPLNFTPWPVTIVATLIYAALFISIIVVHTVVPPAPSNPVPFHGINITEAWADLQVLTNGYRPYNSRRNDEVRNWLLMRIEGILEENGEKDASEEGHEGGRTLGSSDSLGPQDKSSNTWPLPGTRESHFKVHGVGHKAIVYNDLVSNVTFSYDGGPSSSGRQHKPGLSVYFEGTNIIVYIPGSTDDNRDYSVAGVLHRASRADGVLVNVHYDSVSTGFGATDDGVGVVSALQLVKYYTTPGNQPKKGLVVLFNNGEEDFLNGARAFTQHPISRFPRVFLNLEGAGAGGRAILFRSTDTEVTRAYAQSPHPFGSALSADGFKRGLVRSQTDYVVFQGILGLRGLDVAFFEPRARYHTDQDDARHTSTASLWHMLSAALSTTQSLTSDTSSTFDGSNNRGDGGKGGRGSDSVWFDLYGQAFAVFRLRTLFALSVVLLVFAPLILLVLILVLSKMEKMYFFSARASANSSPDARSIALHGWRGFTRFPLALAVSTAAVVGLAYLITKVNPFIVYSSPYAVWSMMMSAWVFLFWFCLSMANWIRPSALYRGYALIWMFILGWAVLVAATVLEDRYQVAGTYLIFFNFCGLFLATLITLLECFALPRKSAYAKSHGARTTPPLRPDSGHSSALMAPSADEQAALDPPRGAGDGEEPTESTPLFRGERRTTFAHYSRSGHGREDVDGTEDANNVDKTHDDEEPWGKALNKWTWLFQLLLIGPFSVILFGQVGLLFVSSTYQTGADGNSLLFIYLSIALFSTVILFPLGPFLHRFTHHIPLALLAVFAGTLIYNLVAFPFSANNRYKVYFIQTVDLETGLNYVSLSGVRPIVEDIISTIPSAAGQDLDCSEEPRGKAGLTRCSWRGIPPNVVENMPPKIPPEMGYADWVHYNVSRVGGTNEAIFHLYGRNSRACKLQFRRPVSDLHVDGAAQDDRFRAVPSEGGSHEIRLWRREWERPWQVWVRWPPADEQDKDHDDGLDGKVVCLWSDENETGVIPALDELRRYAPEWVAITKLADGLVEGEKKFMV